MKPQIFEGTGEELAKQVAAFGKSRLKLIVVEEASKGKWEPVPNHFYFTATPEEWSKALDEAAEKHRGSPVLPPEAFDRESLYADGEEF